MSLDNRKLKLTLLALFIGAWIFGVGQLGFSYYGKEKSDKPEETTIVRTASSTSEAMKNKSMLLTGIVGVIYYFYEK